MPTNDKGAIEREVLAQAGVTAEPAGWKLVPIKLTPEMRAAWYKAPQNEDDDIEFAGAYQAMIDAAPTIRAQVPAAEVRADDLKAIEKAVDVLDAFGNLPDHMMHPGPWKGRKAEDKIKAAREAISNLRSLAHQSTADKASEVRAAEWQPIETAPKDMASRLYLIDRFCVQGFVDATGELMAQSEVSPHWRKMRGKPTHWMPLPAAPSTADSANTGALGEKGGRDDA